MKKAVIITIIFLALGVVINVRIWEAFHFNYDVYDNALQIQTEEEFSDAIESYNGYVFAYGNLEAKDTVSISDIEGEYSFIQIETQKYEVRRNTRANYDSRNGWYYTYYYTDEWNVIETEELHSSEVYFLGMELDYEIIDFLESYELTVLETNDEDIRKVYKVCDSEYTGTMYFQITNGTIDNISFYENMTIKQTINSLKNIFYEIFTYVGLWICVFIIDIVVVDIVVNRKKNY